MTRIASAFIRYLVAATCSCAAMAAAATDLARVAVVGDLDEVNIGQAGYCGDRKNIPIEARQKIYVQGGERVWFRMKTGHFGQSATISCSGEYNFLPEAGQMYILRFTSLGDRCVSELFKVIPGDSPKSEPLTRSASESCLFK